MTYFRPKDELTNCQHRVNLLIVTKRVVIMSVYIFEMILKIIPTSHICRQ
jgi:hypothetical protein